MTRTLLDRYVALKICAATCQRTEVDLLQRLKDNDKHAQLLDHTHDILDAFEHTSPNGMHQILVLQPLGRTLAHFIEHAASHNGFTSIPRTSFVRHISRQLVLGLGHIHSCGIVHRGRLEHKF